MRKIGVFIVLADKVTLSPLQFLASKNYNLAVYTFPSPTFSSHLKGTRRDLQICRRHHLNTLPPQRSSQGPTAGSRQHLNAKRSNVLDGYSVYILVQRQKKKANHTNEKDLLTLWQRQF